MKDSVAALAKASKGVLYPSESDEPFEVLSVEQTSLAEAFEFDDEQPGLKGLETAITKYLSDVQVFRIGTGQVEVQLLIVGKCKIDPEKMVALRTRLIET